MLIHVVEEYEHQTITCKLNQNRNNFDCKIVMFSIPTNEADHIHKYLQNIVVNELVQFGQ